jgi:uncharacterized protein YndB with AHSA1/START domain
MKLEISQVIDRPPAEVFRFIATDHVVNHPRWDPFMQLEQLSEGPIGVGTVIRRRSSRSGAVVEGTMEVVEYEPDRLFGLLIRDGSLVMHSRLRFEPVGERSTRITGSLDVPAMEAPMDPRPIEGSLRRMKELIEQPPT